MSQPYVGQILLFAGTFPPLNYAVCDGSAIAISANPTLYNLIGTTYGGDGVNTFNLPDFRGRVPISMGTGNGLPTYALGASGGTEQVALNTLQLPLHTHPAATTANASATNPSGAIFADAVGVQGLDAYASGTSAQQALSPASVSQAGSSLPHENRQPFLSIMICIALYGVYPTQN